MCGIGCESMKEKHVFITLLIILYKKSRWGETQIVGIMEIGYICDILNRNPNKKIKNTLSSLLCLNQIIAECYTILCGCLDVFYVPITV